MPGDGLLAQRPQLAELVPPRPEKVHEHPPPPPEQFQERPFLLEMGQRWHLELRQLEDKPPPPSLLLGRELELRCRAHPLRDPYQRTPPALLRPPSKKEQIDLLPQHPRGLEYRRM